MTQLVPTPTSPKERSLRCLAYNHDSTVRHVENPDDISELLGDGHHFVWLDLADPTAADLKMLQREFGLHPVAIEDAALWHERPKIEFFEGYCLVVAHGATLDQDGTLITHEIAILAGDRYLVTLRTFPLYPLAEIERRWQSKISLPHDSTALLYTILDAIVDDYFPLTERYDDRLVRLESHLFDQERFMERTEREIFRFKRALTMFRAIVAPMREILLRLTHSEVAPLKPELSIYFRDAHDHVLRVIEQIDIVRDLVNSTLDIHLATQSHRQNEVSKQLTIIATIFLPLTYITGFFGQNFGWMVNGIANPEIFWFLGVGSQVATVVFLFWYFRHRGWF